MKNRTFSICSPMKFVDPDLIVRAEHDEVILEQVEQEDLGLDFKHLGKSIVQLLRASVNADLK